MLMSLKNFCQRLFCSNSNSFSFIKFIKICYIVVKIISLIFNIFLFDLSHLYVCSIELHSPNFCFFASIKFNARNIIFNQRPFVINKINSNSSKNCKNYYHQYNIHCTRTIFIFTFIFSKSYFS